MPEVVPNGGYKVVASEGKFKVKVLDIGGSTRGFAPEVFDTQADAEAFVASKGDEISAPAVEVKPEFVPEAPVAPSAPEAPVVVGSDAPVVPESSVEPENVVVPSTNQPQE